MEKACYAAYFLELAELVAQENLEAPQMVELLYLSLKALLHKGLKNDLVRRIFELRMLMLEGEYTEEPPLPSGKSVQEAWHHVLAAPLGRLYTFTLEEGTLLSFSQNVDYLCKESFPKQFQSLRILKSLGS